MSEPSSTPWWHHTVVYQIYPRSFCDTNGDGIGDLQGIISRLDTLCELGVETLWCSPFFASPQADFGYDICDYQSIAPEYGSIALAEQLIQEVHARGMKVVFDMVMNHTSMEHPWFQASRSSVDDPKRDWYIWRKGQKAGGKQPPNNWKAMIGGSGWQYDKQTDEWYWATFLPFQPDLNYRNPAVKEAMLNNVRFWLERGVDGFRLDIFNAIFKDASFENNPFSWRFIPTESDPNGFFQKNVHTIDHPDTFAFAKELRAVVDEFQVPERFLVGEVFGTADTLKRYCGNQDGLHMVFLFETLTVAPKASAIRAVMQEFEHHFGAPFVPTYVWGNHDRPRRLGFLAEQDERLPAMFATLQLTARGVPFIYYGEEIGMRHADLPLEGALDPMAHRYQWLPEWLARRLTRMGVLLNRDGCRTPMQWEPTPHGGFTTETATPWLPSQSDSHERNVAVQRESPDSLWRTYQTLLALRKQHPALHGGTLAFAKEWADDPSIVGYWRHESGTQQDHSILVLLNVSNARHVLPGSVGEMTCLFSSRHRTSIASDGGPSFIWPMEALVLGR